MQVCELAEGLKELLVVLGRAKGQVSFSATIREDYGDLR